jgi:deazaflavin-dependent oxidoreductase (nitroreductase family)
MPAKQSQSLMHRITVAVGPIGRPVAGTRWFPLYAILRHTGRKSGKPYAIPVVSFATPDGFVIPLPFGEETQWMQNLFASPGGMRWRAHEYVIDRPERVNLDDPAVVDAVPRILRTAARTLGIVRWVRVRRSG